MPDPGFPSWLTWPYAARPSSPEFIQSQPIEMVVLPRRESPRPTTTPDDNDHEPTAEEIDADIRAAAKIWETDAEEIDDEIRAAVKTWNSVGGAWETVAL